jgi:ribosome biogenesis GTPase
VRVPHLEALGFGPFFAAQLGEADAALVPGRVLADLGPWLVVRYEEGERNTVVPGKLRGGRGAPVVGDFVLAPPGPSPAVARVLERRTRLSRNVAGRAVGEQVLAANVDVVFVVEAIDGAGHLERRIERSVAAVMAGGAEPVVLLTKCDLTDDLEPFLEAARAAAPGADVVPASGRSGLGLEAVRAHLPAGRTGAFMGPSGAGKSTLVNALLGEEIQATGDVREHDRRGRHVTTARRLFRLPGGGSVVDGPGIRELKLWDAGGLHGAFEDLAGLAARCRFADCAHETEPGCAVRAALERGELDEARLESYRKLARESVVQAARRGDPAARDQRKRHEKMLSRAIRRFQRERGDKD